MQSCCRLLIGCLIIGCGSNAQADDRYVQLEGQANFRDIGGYKTEDGETVKRGLVYRSGELPRLTDKDVAKLTQLGITSVIGFLTDVEIAARGRNRLPKGLKEISLPIITSRFAAILSSSEDSPK